MIGIENEYSAFFRGADRVVRNLPPPDYLDFLQRCSDLLLIPQTWVATMVGYSPSVYTKGMTWLKNGGQVYLDRMCFEYASSECETVSDLVLIDKVGDLIVKEIFGSRGEDAESTFVMKRSLSQHQKKENSRGSHENYSIPAQLFQSIIWKETRTVDATILGAHLASRPIYSGAGHLQFVSSGSKKKLVFWISPRVQVVGTLASEDTTGLRSLINTRDRPFATPSLKRLHLVCGDMNRSDWSVYLKIGTTLLVLTYLELARTKTKERLCRLLGEVDPIMMFRGGSAPFVRDKRNQDLFGTMISVQRQILSFLEVRRDALRERVSETDTIMEMWCVALDDVSRVLDGTGVCSVKLDWFIKKKIYEEKIGDSLFSLERVCDQDIIRALLNFDFSYHRINHHDLYRGLVDANIIVPLFSYEDARRYYTTPPQGRAFVRTEVIRRLIERGLQDAITMVQWHGVSVKIGEQTPFFTFCNRDVSMLDSDVDSFLEGAYNDTKRTQRRTART